MTAHELSAFFARLPPETPVVIAEACSLTLRSVHADDQYHIYLPITAEKHLHACLLAQDQIFPQHTPPELLPRGARAALLIGPHEGGL